MALTIGLVIGERVIINGRPMTLLATGREGAMVSYRSKTWPITTLEATLLEPNVSVSVGKDSGSSTRTRLAFEAPLSVKIERDKNLETPLAVSPDLTRMLFANGLNEKGVLQMYGRSAKVRHPHGDRRFHDWVFATQNGLIVKISKFTGSHLLPRNKSGQYDPHEHCKNKGCEVCGWSGFLPYQM